VAWTDPCKVLATHPDPVILTDLMRRLEEHGYEVQTAAGPEEGEALAATFRPDILLWSASFGSPGDGLAAAGRIRADLGIPVILLVGDPQPLPDPFTRAVLGFDPDGLTTRSIELELYIKIALARMNHDLRRRKEPVSDVEDREVLIVEDEKIVGLDLARRLDRMGFGISGAATSAERGILLARERRPSLVSHGMMLEGPMFGIEGATRIKGELDIPVCFVCAYADEKTVDRACESRSADGYILKPLKERELYLEFHRELRRYARLQARWDPDGLFRAARAGTEAEVRALCSGGARTDSRSPKGRTPLMHAAVFAEDPGVIRALAEAGADPNDRDPRGLTALMLAAGNPEPAIARALLEAGADPEARDAEGSDAAGHAPGKLFERLRWNPDRSTMNGVYL
jgi:DNA-binding response OmpR family regulator